MPGPQKITAHYSNNPKAISNTRINTFMNCPLKHYFTYMLGMWPPMDKPAMNLGTAGHATLEKFHANTGKFKTMGDAKKFIKSTWVQEWTNMKEQGLAVEDKRTSFESNMELGYELLEQYLQNYKKGMTFGLLKYKYPDMEEYKPAIELPFRIPMQNLNTGQIIVPGYDIQGFIDLAAIINGEIHILDHKFAAIMLDGWLLENDFQLVIYAYAIKYLQQRGVIDGLEYNTDPVNVGLNYILKPYFGPNYQNKRNHVDFQRKSRSISIDEIHGVLNIFASMVKKFDQEPYPCYTSDCSWKCDLHGVCQAFRTGQDPVKAFIHDFGFEPGYKNQDNKKSEQEVDW